MTLMLVTLLLYTVNVEGFVRPSWVSPLTRHREGKQYYVSARRSTNTGQVPTAPSPSSSPSSSSTSLSSASKRRRGGNGAAAWGVDRRQSLATLTSSLALAAAAASPLAAFAEEAAAAGSEVPWEVADRPNDAACTFRYPPGFVTYGKPLKTHLSEYNLKKEGVRGYVVGVAVDPVKLKSLESFGDPNFVADKIIGVERKKDGVLSAELLGASAAKDGAGKTYYTVEYASENVHSGLNRFISRIAIEDEKLYVFTAQSKEKDFLPDRADEMRKIVQSFELRG